MYDCHFKTAILNKVLVSVRWKQKLFRQFQCYVALMSPAKGLVSKFVNLCKIVIPGNLYFIIICI